MSKKYHPFSMKTYAIHVEICLGMSHCGGEYTDGSDEITLSDSEIETLYSIMEKAYAEDEDLSELNLANTDLEKVNPDLYHKIYDAYYECEEYANLVYWTADGFTNQDLELDRDEIREICIKRWGYEPMEQGEDEEDYDYESAESDRFWDWFRENILHNEGQLLSFEEEENILDMCVEFDFSGELPLPPELVKEFLKTKGK